MNVIDVKTKEDFIAYQQSVIERQSEQIINLMNQVGMLLSKLAEKDVE